MAADVSSTQGSTLTEAATQVAQRLKRPALKPASIGAIVLILDVAVVTLSFWFAEFVAVGASISAGPAAAAAVLSGCITVALVLATRGYRLGALRRFWHGWLKLAAAGLIVSVAGLVAGSWSSWSVALAPALLGLPARAHAWLLARAALDYGMTERRAVVLGGGAEAEALIRGLAANPENDIRICGIFDDRTDLRSPPVVIGTPKLGSVGEALAFVRSAEVELIIIAMPLSAKRRIQEILEQVRVLPVDVRLSAYSANYTFPRRGQAAGLIAVLQRPLEGWRWLIKRGLDIAGATAALVLLLPILLALAVAVRIDSRGPVLFRQARQGYNNRPIVVWKFRSMQAGETDPGARRLVTRDDPRVTRVGRFLRRWSLDELPQFFNVLRGDLSLVGPRPHVPDAISTNERAFEEIVAGYAARHRVPPGITGWAQVQGWRGEIDTAEKLEARVAHDLYYIENWSIWLDLYILAMTPLRLLDGRHAY